MYGALRRMLFQMDPERAHHMALRALAPAHRSAIARLALPSPTPSPRLAMEVMGLQFPAPLGMAAGFDKEARVYNALLGIGFSHVEVGTVTPRPQPGNPPPRMARLSDHQALVNRLGFPGPGSATIAARLQRHEAIGIVGANIGPNKDTPPGGIADDIAQVAEALAPYAEFLTINVSSPNTPGLRSQQAPSSASALVAAALEAADAAASPRPVLLKLHPDAPDADIVQVARAAVDAGAAAIVAVNTTQARPPGTESAMQGGLSGRPLHERAVQAIGALHRGLRGEAPIVGVGGIFSGADAFAHIAAGASLVQAYTGFIYGGPRMPAQVHAGLVEALDHAGLDNLSEAVGRDT